MADPSYLSVAIYLFGSLFGVFLGIFFTWFGDIETLDWGFLNSITDEWSLLFMLLLYSFAVFCFLKLHLEVKRFFKPTFQSLKWWEKGVMYQIYPKSFKDTNNDGVGDLRGIIEKVEYLKKIGVNIVWMNPIYPAGGKDNGYDVTSFLEIDKRYGTMTDFDILVNELHKNNMYLLMDFIPNHTSNKHEWFIKSCENDSKYADYYVWYPSKDSKNPPNNWVSVMGISAWTYNDKRKAWYYHSFLPEQPDLNLRNEDVREEMRNIIRFWLKTRKIDGLRIDAIKHMFVDLSFKDEPRSSTPHPIDISHVYSTYDHKYTLSLPECFQIMSEWRELADEIGKETDTSKLLVVETYGHPSEQVQYLSYKDKPAAHFPFNFQLVNLCENPRVCLSNLREMVPFKPRQLKKLVDEWNKQRNKKYFCSNWQLGNHDCARVASRLGKENVNLANALILLLGGTPVTYYGEEIGMEDLDYDSMTFDQCQDEFGKTYGPKDYKKYNRDYARSPMQWNDHASAGFTKDGVKTWLPINPNHKQVNVENQLKDPKSPLRIYMELVKIRQNPAFLWGALQYAIVDDHVFSFIRESFDYSSFLVAMNLDDEDIIVNFMATRLMPSSAHVVLYFQHENTQRKEKDGLTGKSPAYEPNQKILTKNVQLKARSCLILTWFSS